MTAGILGLRKNCGYEPPQIAPSWPTGISAGPALITSKHIRRVLLTEADTVKMFRVAFVGLLAAAAVDAFMAPAPMMLRSANARCLVLRSTAEKTVQTRVMTGNARCGVSHFSAWYSQIIGRTKVRCHLA